MKTLKVSALVAALFVSGSVFAAKEAPKAEADKKEAKAAVNDLAATAKTSIDEARKLAKDGKLTAEAAQKAFNDEAAFNKASDDAGFVGRNWARVTRNPGKSALAGLAIVAAGAVAYKAYSCTQCENAEGEAAVQA